jgi:hypothetical protein
LEGEVIDQGSEGGDVGSNAASGDGRGERMEWELQVDFQAASMAIFDAKAAIELSMKNPDNLRMKLRAAELGSKAGDNYLTLLEQQAELEEGDLEGDEKGVKFRNSLPAIISILQWPIPTSPIVQQIQLTTPITTNTKKETFGGVRINAISAAGRKSAIIPGWMDCCMVEDRPKYIGFNYLTDEYMKLHEKTFNEMVTAIRKKPDVELLPKLLVLEENLIFKQWRTATVRFGIAMDVFNWKSFESILAHFKLIVSSFLESMSLVARARADVFAS